jgi:hypothetical protein
MGHHRGRRLGIGIADRFTAPISMPALDISKLPTGAGISANEPRLIEGQHASDGEIWWVALADFRLVITQQVERAKVRLG